MIRAVIRRASQRRFNDLAPRLKKRRRVRVNAERDPDNFYRHASHIVLMQVSAGGRKCAY